MRSEKRRLAALVAAINSAGSFTAKLADLNDEQRRIYERWRDQTDQWHATFTEPGEAYMASITGDRGPRLREDVRFALFGPVIGIPTDASDAEAADIYRRTTFGH